MPYRYRVEISVPPRPCPSPRSWAEVTVAMAAMLEALANDEPPDQLRGSPEWKDARAWAWVMRTGELTGTGSRHAWRPRPCERNTPESSPVQVPRCEAGLLALYSLAKRRTPEDTSDLPTRPAGCEVRGSEGADMAGTSRRLRLGVTARGHGCPFQETVRVELRGFEPLTP